MEDIKTEINEEIGKEESLIKKGIIALVAIFIIGLMLSYVFVVYPIGDIIKGRIESSQIKNEVIDLGNFSIFFENQTYSNIKKMYFDEQKTEFSMCLLGTKENDFYYVKSFYVPETYSKTFSQVSFKSCSQDTIILLHTHPYKSCIASEQDIQTLNETKKDNPNALMVIMCEPERFSVYS